MSDTEQPEPDEPLPDESPVDAAIIAITDEVGAIGKNRQAPDDIGGFKFRGIEDALNHLHPLLVRHRLVIKPRMVARTVEMIGQRRLVTVEVEYDFRCGGVVDTFGPFPGEGADGQDKAANKAMSGAWKVMAFEVFTIPIVDASTDSEAYNPRDEEPPTVEELWSKVDEKTATAAEAQQERLDNLPAELHDKALHRMTQRVNQPGLEVTCIRDLGPGWLSQFTKVLDKAWEAAEADKEPAA